MNRDFHPKIIWAKRKQNNLFRKHTKSNHNSLGGQNIVFKLKEIHDFLIFLVMIQLSLITPQLKTNILLDSKYDTREYHIQKQTQRFPNQTYDYLDWGEGWKWKVEIGIYIPLYTKLMRNKNLLYSAVKCILRSLIAYTGNELKKNGCVCTCSANSSCCTPETNTALDKSTIPQ